MFGQLCIQNMEIKVVQCGFHNNICVHSKYGDKRAMSVLWSNDTHVQVKTKDKALKYEL